VSSLDERRAGFQRYKDNVKRRGKPFFPYAMFHDTVMSLVVVSVITVLAIIWKYGLFGNHILGPLIGLKADPGTTSFVPRPDWYFYFLFYLLRIFKWPETVILATIGIPTLCLVLLLVLPFLDVRTERRLTRRPVAVVAAILTVISMGVLTYKGATAKEAIARVVGPFANAVQERGYVAAIPLAVLIVFTRDQSAARACLPGRLFATATQTSVAAAPATRACFTVRQAPTRRCLGTTRRRSRLGRTHE